MNQVSWREVRPAGRIYKILSQHYSRFAVPDPDPLMELRSEKNDEEDGRRCWNFDQGVGEAKGNLK